ncbi:RIB43A-like with coiled-coils protein 2 [Penaeus monodon]|uniref:RIB43A-like with coiled-coils protein 2 n=1 Tax=Penaeus monodon TaxID=6687 RepID=UPI0018A6F2D5|nr:RIB43A-like with coiled-coils protein 2 [Penaeus monodon]
MAPDPQPPPASAPSLSKPGPPPPPAPPEANLPPGTFGSSAHKSRVATVSAGCPALPSWVLDEREAARIARRRRLLQERAHRIHQPRVTSIAVDVQALSSQVEERRRYEEEERRKEEEFMRLAATQDRAALLLQQREDEARANQRHDLTKFWREEQRPERRREYDLNCHDHLISTLYDLSFEGEDENLPERVKAQRQQTEAWLRQQKEEKRVRGLQEREHERLLQLEEMEAAEKARQMEEADRLCRHAQRLADEHYNKELSQERQRAKEQQRQQEWQQEEQELRGAIFGSFLTEDPAMAHSALGPHRVITDRWKGMSPEQKEEIQDIRERQMEEKKRRDEAAQRERQEWEEHAARADRVGVLLEHRDAKARRQHEATLVSANSVLASDQRQQEQRRNQLYTLNIPNEDYYNQFGIYPR